MFERVAVIGSGPAGAAAAHRLSAAGREVVLFERAAEAGGRTASWKLGDAVVDSGAGFFTNFYPAVAELLPELGLEAGVVTLSRSNALVHEGQVAVLSVGSTRSFLRFPLVRMRGKLRMTAHVGFASARHRRLDLSRPESLARLDDRSVRDHAVARLGEEVYEFLVRPGVEPFWYFSCADVSRSLSLGLQARAATARFFTLRGGMDTIAKGLAAAAELRVATEVTAIERAGAGVTVDGEAFDAAVVATTAEPALQMAGAVVPAGIREFVASQRYVPNVHAAFRVPRAAAPPESARLPCGPGEHPVAAIACQSNKQQGTIPPDEEIVSVYLAAAPSAELIGASDEAIYERAWSLAREFSPDLPPTAEPLACIARATAIPVHAVGRYRSAAAAWAEQRPPVVAAGDYLATATVDGALRSGLRAADVLLAG